MQGRWLDSGGGGKGFVSGRGGGGVVGKGRERGW